MIESSDQNISLSLKQKLDSVPQDQTIQASTIKSISDDLDIHLETKNQTL